MHIWCAQSLVVCTYIYFCIIIAWLSHNCTATVPVVVVSSWPSYTCVVTIVGGDSQSCSLQGGKLAGVCPCNNHCKYCTIPSIFLCCYPACNTVSAHAPLYILLRILQYEYVSDFSSGSIGSTYILYCLREYDCAKIMQLVPGLQSKHGWAFVLKHALCHRYIK